MTTLARPGRSWHVLALSAVAGAVVLAPASYAAPEHCGPTVEPAQVEALRVRLVQHAAGLRVGRVTPVEVQVRRDGAEPTALTRLDGAHVSLRVRTGRVTSYVDGTLDASGHALLAVTLDSRAVTGAAEVLVDVWSEPVPSRGCQQVVREHGAAEAATRVSR